jgi:hypothetical protein
MASESKVSTISYVIGDPYDTELDEAVRRLRSRLPWTARETLRWQAFSMLWLAVASVPACCDDYESAERQSVLWAERAAALPR